MSMDKTLSIGNNGEKYVQSFFAGEGVGPITIELTPPTAKAGGFSVR